MCQSLSQGGKRCDCDSSGKRRLRRKTESRLRRNSMDSRFSQQTASVMSDIDDVKETVEFINDRFED